MARGTSRPWRRPKPRRTGGVLSRGTEVGAAARGPGLGQSAWLDWGHGSPSLAAPDLTPGNTARGADRRFANVPFCRKLPGGGEGDFLMNCIVPGVTRRDQGHRSQRDGRTIDRSLWGEDEMTGG